MKRCQVCSTKLRLGQPYSCRCGGRFCPRHVIQAEHSCTFDFKKQQRDLLKKHLKAIRPSKIETI